MQRFFVAMNQRQKQIAEAGELSNLKFKDSKGLVSLLEQEIDLE